MNTYNKLLLLIFSIFIARCTITDPILKAEKLLENYDRATAKEFLIDSILLVDYGWETYNLYLDNFRLPPLENKESIKKLDIFVVPVLDLSEKALQYDYSQNIIQYLTPLNPDWYENYKSFVFYESHLVGVLNANKKPNQSWRAWHSSSFDEEQSYLVDVIDKHHDSLFFSQIINAFCYIDNNELYVCLIKLNRSDRFDEFLKGYFTIKELKNRIRMREKRLGANIYE